MAENRGQPYSPATDNMTTDNMTIAKGQRPLLTLALGANLGDRARTLAAARRAIGEQIGPILAVSTLLETPAWGVTDQPDFLNQVVVLSIAIELPLHPRPRLHHLLNITQSIENSLGLDRTTKTHWGPRNCDIDLIFLDDIHYEDERISLPHPWWAERDFVGGLIQRELIEVLPFPGQW